MKELLKGVLTMSLICLLFIVKGQSTGKISTMDFVQILNENREETIYYYENNWKQLRENAIREGYIDSYQLLEVQREEELAFDLILVTTYLNQDQYDKREPNFGKLIEAAGGLKLLNEKKPGDFRKNVFFREDIVHLFEGGM